MNCVAVDTNVAVAANRNSDCGLECVTSCIEELERVIKNCKVCIDDKQIIFQEYIRHLAFKGQPGVGDAFFKWLWDNQGNIERCDQVSVTATDDSRRFLEFPDDPRLEGFDYDDRIFVAVVIASNSDPIIVNAVDTDWHIFREALVEHDVYVKELCLGEIKASLRARA